MTPPRLRLASERPPERRPPGGRVFWLVVAALALGALTAFLWWRYPGAVRSNEDIAQLVALVAFGALVASGLLMGRRIGLGQALRHLFVWAAIGLVVVVGLSYRAELGAVLDRVTGELSPTQGVATGERALSFRASLGGDFLIDARVDGTPVRFVVDTGATHVVLSKADAERLGFEPAALRYSQPFRTANGTVMAAPVTLPSLAIGEARFEQVRAYVNDGELDRSLLGMDLLRRFESYEVRDGTLTLRW